MLLEVGSGAARQRRLVEGGGTLVDVVHHLVESSQPTLPMTAVSTGVGDRRRRPRPWLGEHGEGLIAIRRNIHAHPELSGDEHATTELVAERLELAGLHRARSRRNRADLRSRPPTDTGAVVSWRCAPISTPWRCTTRRRSVSRARSPGVAHACGHDVHTAVVLGTALYFAHHLDELPGPLRFVFQPAEERVPGGAST